MSMMILIFYLGPAVLHVFHLFRTLHKEQE